MPGELRGLREFGAAAVKHALHHSAAASLLREVDIRTKLRGELQDVGMARDPQAPLAPGRVGNTCYTAEEPLGGLPGRLTPLLARSHCSQDFEEGKPWLISLELERQAPMVRLECHGFPRQA
jgi:hypothetical protein